MLTINRPYVCISVQSTAQCKYYNYPGGWDIVVEKLNLIGFPVVCIDKVFWHGTGDTINYAPKNAIDATGKSLEETMQMLSGCEFFIGTSSGLSWLAWGMGKHVILISGITPPDFEFTGNGSRIINEDVCHGCLSDVNHKFDAGDWMWCPRYKGTDRQFECTREIHPKIILDAVYSFIEK